MPEPFIALVAVIPDCDSGGVVGKPDTVPAIHINVIDIVSVHAVVAGVVGGYIGFGH